MIYPLVRELAVDGIPVTVTCRVLKIARQPYYRWFRAPITETELVEAYRANALFDAHKDVNRPGESGDSSPWEGWGHVRKNVEEVPGRAA